MSFLPTGFMLETTSIEDDRGSCPPTYVSSILTSCSPHSSFHGKRSMSFSGIDAYSEECNAEDELSDDGFQAGEKKRRLNTEQVKALEKNFELGNKLEPERKMQLAKALGLQPRQIAIWFQNKRARWKAKQLEKDYDLLKIKFDAVKSDNDILRAQNQKMQAEILALKSKEATMFINLNKETEGSSSNKSETSSDIKLDVSRTPAIDSPISNQHIPCRSFLQSSSSSITTITTIAAVPSTQSFQKSPRSHQHCQKLDLPVAKDEPFSNLFCSIDDQSGFWPWLDHEHFN